MKVKEFLSVFKDPYVLFPIYLFKSIIISYGMVDFWILGAISFMALFEKVISKLDLGFNRFFDTKEKVLSENVFRNAVNTDISKLMEEVNTLKMINSSKNGLFGKQK